jgi:hypothetical protein
VAFGKVDGTQTKTKPGDHMDSQIVAVFCLCDDILKAIYHSEDRQQRITDAEVMTIALAAALHFVATRRKPIAFCTSMATSSIC